MIVGEIFTASVEGLAAGGAGIAEYRGERIFIDMSAPGDRVRGRIREIRGGRLRGELLELLEPSVLRAVPPCPLYGLCGGCSLQHLSYEAQLAGKNRILRDAFRRIGGLEPPESRIFPSPPWEYRNRMQLHRVRAPLRGKRRPGKGGSEGRLGLKGRESDDVVPVSDCPVADPGIRSALRGGKLVPPVEKDRFTVYSRFNTFLSEGEKSRGQAALLDRELRLDAGVFFQSNGAVLEILIRRLVELAGEADRDLPLGDIYCGVGTFAAFLGDLFPRIDLVEENPAALALARENIPHRRAAFYAMTGDRWVKGRNPSGNREPYGFVVLDPPRTGLSPALRGWICREGPPVFAYVSCDPATLARDSGEILRGGYEITELNFYDFYPQTAHVESLAVFRRTGVSHNL